VAAGPDHPSYEYLPDTLLRQTDTAPLIGATVTDRWMNNADGSQAVWYRPEGGGPWVCNLIDRGFCFRAQHWNYEEALSFCGIYPRRWIYEHVTGPESFDPWLSAIQALRWPDLREVADQVPREWLEGPQERWTLDRMLSELLSRAKRLPELLAGARASYRNPFPGWN
jgi:hypothetical protein